MSRYFIDNESRIWSVSLAGQCDYPGQLTIESDRVIVLGERDATANTESYAIEDVFTLHPSLTALALAIEHTPPPSPDGSVSLTQAVATALHHTLAFEQYWLASHRRCPEHFPMVFPEENSGMWQEQMYDADVDEFLSA